MGKGEGGGGGQATNAKCVNILGDQRPETCRAMFPVHGS
jgi:hypothetical protein